MACVGQQGHRKQTILITVLRITLILLIHHHHHRMSVMELGHLLTRFGLTYLEVSPEVCHDSFCQLGE